MLEESKEERREPKQKREITETVYSRWYRAPEIILLDHNYNQAADVWALGCILAEMVNCSTPYVEKKNYQYHKRVMFQGSCCHPISPSKAAQNEKPEEKYQLSIDEND